jgi:rhodanese-related sulfurtransferase
MISSRAVHERLAQGKSVCLIDVRTPAEYARLHATGARLVPLDQLDPNELARARNSGDEPIYVICQSGSRASRACEKLAAASVSGVYCVEGGTAAWEADGLPVERGRSAHISLERQVRIAAGLLVVLGIALAWAVHPAFLVLPLFVGSGLVFAGVTDFCGMALFLAKMPWNR